MVPGHRRCVGGVLIWEATDSFEAPEFTSLRSMASDLHMMRATRRPMRPKPLMPPATAMEGAAGTAEAGRTLAGRVFEVDVNAAAPEARRASLTMIAKVFCERGF